MLEINDCHYIVDTESIETFFKTLKMSLRANKNYEDIDKDNQVCTYFSIRAISRAILDWEINIFQSVKSKSLIKNRYATKKTIAQGLLDVALLTSNTTQLRYLLSEGDHPFYNLVFTLIIISIALQVNQFWFLPLWKHERYMNFICF